MDKGDREQILFVIKAISIAIFVIIAVIWGFSAGGRMYDVWAQKKRGEAELAHAQSNRQIKTLEAKAFEESSKHLAEAEIIRAKGVAEANKIIGESLKNNEGYLRYLWITSLQSSNKEIIYVPTEANIPILEAGKR
jgi:hypothetical protein